MNWSIECCFHPDKGLDFERICAFTFGDDADSIFDNYKAALKEGCVRLLYSGLSGKSVEQEFHSGECKHHKGGA